MKIKPFQLERYFARYEFDAPYLLSASDCESLSLQEVLGLADAETLALWNDLKLGYTESQGHPLLRREIAGLYAHVSPAEVLVAAPEEAIFIAMHALLAAGDHVIVTFPGYQSLYEVAQSAGCRVTRWPLRIGDDGWQLDLGFLEQNITSRTKLLVVNFPHNPTGYLPTRAEWDAIVSLARRHDLYLFCDEMYRLLEYEPARRLSPVCDLYEKGLSLFGLSKTFSLPGLRIGWLATQNREIVDKCVLLKDYTTICSSAPSEILGLIALRARETIVERNLGILRRNLGVADRFFAAYADTFDWPRPQAGSIAFPRLKGKTSAEQFCREALGQGVMIVPASIFDFSGNHFRLGLGRENFPQAIEQIRPLVNALRGD